MRRRPCCQAFGFLLLALLAAAPPAAAEPPVEAWVPSRTWVFAVGITHWKDGKEFKSFPKKGRLEPVLMDAFKKCGVPAEQVTYLEDAAATQAHIEAALTGLLNKTRAGDTLVVYFAGHGYWDRDTGRHFFACYDCDDSHTWAVDSIFDGIDRRFKGRRALLIADCCGSGGLVTAARARQSKVQYAALASSFRNNLSTGSWTFTACLLKGLRADPAVDLNGDGVITLWELAHFAEIEMAFIESQRAVAFFGDAFSSTYRLRSTQGKHDPTAGAHVEAKWRDGNWWKAETVGRKDGKVNVRYTDDDSTAWVTAAEVRAWKPPVQFDVGSKVLARPEEDDTKWRAATVSRTFEGLHYVRFDDVKNYDSQWVGYDQIRAR